jgi:hypothetical protein
MVPLLLPDVPEKEIVKFEFDCDCATACPVMVKLLCEVMKGKHAVSGLFTELTVAVRLLPLWLKFTFRVVA